MAPGAVDVSGRRRFAASQLTSLVDVLFILLFASLVQQRRSAQAADVVSPTPLEDPPAAPADAGVADAAPPPADPHAAARAVAAQLETDTVILVAVDRTGTVVSIENGGETFAVDHPLLRATVDQRVVTYNATERPDERVCKLVAKTVGVDIAGSLVLVTTEEALRDMPYALVRGLRDDAARCIDDAGAYALIIRASDLPPSHHGQQQTPR